MNLIKLHERGMYIQMLYIYIIKNKLHMACFNVIHI